jgi:hypothetical protein
LQSLRASRGPWPASAARMTSDIDPSYLPKSAPVKSSATSSASRSARSIHAPDTTQDAVHVKESRLWNSVGAIEVRHVKFHPTLTDRRIYRGAINCSRKNVNHLDRKTAWAGNYTLVGSHKK